MPYVPLDESTWTGGLKPEDYFQSLATYKHLVLSLFREAEVAEEDRAAVVACLPAAPAELRLVVVTEDWCGDSAAVLPYITRLAETLAVPIRVFRQSRNSHLKQWYVEQGTDHIPVVSLLRLQETGEGGAPEEGAPDDGAELAWRELMRWVERPDAATERLGQWRAQQPRFDELYARRESDAEAAKEYAGLYARLLRAMASWYRGGLWREIPREWCAALEHA